MYATDVQTDGRTDKSNAYCPFPYGRGHNNQNKYMTTKLSGQLRFRIIASIKLHFIK